MALETIFAIVIILIVIVISWAIFKKLFKIGFYILLVITLLLAVNIFFVYKDMVDLRENFAVDAKKVVLVDFEEVLTGLQLNSEISYLTESELDTIKNQFKNKQYEAMLGDNYKLMIFDLDIVQELDVEEIEFRDEIISKEEAISILKSSDDRTERAELFGILLADHILNSKNPLFFFSQYKKGNIIVYPETALFKTMKFIPLRWMSDIGEKVLYTTKEKAKDIIA
jgi:hypothetical protein